MAKQIDKLEFESETGNRKIHYTVKSWTITCHKGDIPK